MGLRTRERVTYTPEQESILAGIDREVSRPSDVWLKDQIRWRRELVSRYQADIVDLEERLKALGIEDPGEQQD